MLISWSPASSGRPAWTSGCDMNPTSPRVIQRPEIRVVSEPIETVIASPMLVPLRLIDGRRIHAAVIGVNGHGFKVVFMHASLHAPAATDMWLDASTGSVASQKNTFSASKIIADGDTTLDIKGLLAARKQLVATCDRADFERLCEDFARAHADLLARLCCNLTAQDLQHRYLHALQQTGSGDDRMPYQQWCEHHWQSLPIKPAYDPSYAEQVLDLVWASVVTLDNRDAWVKACLGRAPARVPLGSAPVAMQTEFIEAFYMQSSRHKIQTWIERPVTLHRFDGTRMAGIARLRTPTGFGFGKQLGVVVDVDEYSYWIDARTGQCHHHWSNETATTSLFPMHQPTIAQPDFWDFREQVACHRETFEGIVYSLWQAIAFEPRNTVRSRRSDYEQSILQNPLSAFLVPEAVSRLTDKLCVYAWESIVDDIGDRLSLEFVMEITANLGAPPPVVAARLRH